MVRKNYFPHFMHYPTVALCAVSPIAKDSTCSGINTFIAWSESSGNSNNWLLQDNLVNHNPFNIDRQFIKLEQSFLDQLKKHPNVFGDQEQWLLLEKMKVSAGYLTYYECDKISLEITNEGSIFYRMVKNDYKIYFQHFLLDETEDNDEAIVSIFKGNDKNVLNYAGTLAESLQALQNVLFQ